MAIQDSYDHSVEFTPELRACLDSAQDILADKSSSPDAKQQAQLLLFHHIIEPGLADALQYAKVQDPAVDKEDLLGKVFIHLIELVLNGKLRFDLASGKTQAIAYVRQTVRRTIIDLARRLGTQKRDSGTPDLDGMLPDDTDDTQSCPLQSVIELLDGLSADDAAILDRYYRGPRLNAQQHADDMGISAGAFYTRLDRARRRAVALVEEQLLTEQGPLSPETLDDCRERLGLTVSDYSPTELRTAAQSTARLYELPANHAHELTFYLSMTEAPGTNRWSIRLTSFSKENDLANGHDPDLLAKYDNARVRIGWLEGSTNCAMLEMKLAIEDGNLVGLTLHKGNLPTPSEIRLVFERA